MISILDVILEFRVLEVDISDTWWILKWLRIIYSIFELTSWETFKLHDVLCESASFIAEDIVHHAQLFIQVWRLNWGLEPCLLVTNLNVDRDEVSLDEINHFQSHQERNRDKVHQSYEPDSSLYQDLDS